MRADRSAGFLWYLIFWIGVSVNVATAQTASEIVSGAVKETESVREMIERYTADSETLDRRFPLRISPVRYEKMDHFYRGWLGAIDQVRFDSLSQRDRIDLLLLRNRITHELSALETLRTRTNEVLSLLPFAGMVIRFEEERRAMNNVDPEKAASYLDEMQTEIDSVRSALEKRLKDEPGNGKPAGTTPTVANRAAEAARDLREHLADWFHFYDRYDPLFSWWVEAPYKRFDKGLKEYADFLREKIVGVSAGDKDAIIGDPIGREALMQELETEMIPYTPEELVEIAENEYQWCEKEMKKASAELGFGENWHDALEHVKSLHVAPGQQPGLIRDLAYEAVAFVEEHDLVTVPALAQESWRMQMMSPERQKVSPFFTGGEVISVAFPVDSMDHEQKMMSLRGNNIHFSRATVFHELIPGHYLQQFMMERFNQYRTLFWTPFWLEGWALYWEMVLWDEGFPQSPENRIGMLFWRMHRCARIVFSLSFHLGKMTPQECIDYLVEKVGHERDNATAEVRRSFGGDYPPLYQAAYMLGALQFRALEAEVVKGGKMTPREFRDAVLRENIMPVEMLRALLLGLDVQKDEQPHWRFYGGIE